MSNTYWFKLQITKDKIDINLQFYFFLKNIVKLSPSDREVAKIIEEYNLFGHNLSLFSEALGKIFKSETKLEKLEKNQKQINKSSTIR